MDGSLVYLFAALAITWVVIIGYFVLLGSRLASLQRELEALRRHSDGPTDNRDTD